MTSDQYKQDISDAQKKELVCKYCNEDFYGHHRRKYCSDKCKSKQREIQLENYKKEFECKRCGDTYKRQRRRNGFCSRQCASKKYVEDGTYDDWIYNDTAEEIRNREQGEEVECEICEEKFRVKPHKAEDRKFCSQDCFSKGMKGRFSGEDNPMYDRELDNVAPGWKDKQRNTLQEKYGVKNPYQLADHSQLSGPQQEITEFLRDEFDELKIENDKPIDCKEKIYQGDIVIDSLDYIVEFNGTYWHCDPREYEAGYKNKRKNMLAEEIWEYDKNRLEKLRQKGYDVDVIWEKDYNSNKKQILTQIKGKINEKR